MSRRVGTCKEGGRQVALDMLQEVLAFGDLFGAEAAHALCHLPRLPSIQLAKRLPVHINHASKALKRPTYSSPNASLCT